MSRSRLYYNTDTQELLEVDSKPKPVKQWRVIPMQVGIIWSIDQSDNQMTLNWARSQHPDYIFDPRDDMSLFLEYLDQLPYILG